MLERSYREGVLFRQWYEKYEGHMLFCPYMLTSRQIPHSGPIRGPLGFGELLTGTRYLDAGYEALFLYRAVEDMESFKVACELFGGEEAGKFISPNGEKGGRPPDLIVFHAETRRFRFVECKRPGERFTTTQPAKFLGIERYLNCRLDSARALQGTGASLSLLPALAPGRWIHVARFKPERVDHEAPER